MITAAKNRLDKFVENISGDTFLSKKMYREYLSDKDVDLNSFYTTDSCAIMLMGENISLRGCLSDDDMDNILSFCNFMGVYGLETEIDNLPINRKTEMHLMEYDGDRNIHAENITKNSNIYGFSRFCCDNFSGAAFSNVYSFFARKVNKNISDIYYISENGKIISGAVATKYGDDEVYLTFVSTARSQRRKGLATQIIRHIRTENRDKKIILMCEEELMPFYKKMGFISQSNIYLYTLREENI